MRIGLLTTSYPRFPGDAAGCFVEGFARTLASLGYAVEVLCPEPDRPSSRERSPGVDVFEVPYLRPRAAERTFYGAGVPENVRAAPLLALGVPAYTAALDRAIARAAPRLDAFVSHWAIPSGLVAARHARGRPHLAVFHSADVHLLSLLPGRRALARRLLRGTTAAWFVSSDLRDRFLECAGALPDGLRAHVGPMGFTASATPEGDRAARRAALGFARFTVLALSRLVPIKGLDDAVRALARVPEGELVVAGAGPDRERLSSLARTSSARVRFEGHVAFERKSALLHAADAFVLPSVLEAGGRREGIPTALLEAMSAGLPIVATRTGGIPDLVRDGREGILVPPRRPDAIADAIGSLARDPERARALGEAARARASRHAWPAQREAMASLLAR